MIASTFAKSVEEEEDEGGKQDDDDDDELDEATRSEHGKPTITFSKLVDELQQHYGSPAPPPSTDPLELIIWETSRIWRATSVGQQHSTHSNEALEHVPSRFSLPRTPL